MKLTYIDKDTDRVITEYESNIDLVRSVKENNFITEEEILVGCNIFVLNYNSSTCSIYTAGRDTIIILENNVRISSTYSY